MPSSIPKARGAFWWNFISCKVGRLKVEGFSGPALRGLWFNKHVISKIDLSPLNLQPSTPLLAAVSGGADSLALLHVLHGLGYPLVCATFNHRLRPEAAEEVAYVRQV